jgi:hypothetical protein
MPESHKAGGGRWHCLPKVPGSGVLCTSSTATNSEPLQIEVSNVKMAPQSRRQVSGQREHEEARTPFFQEAETSEGLQGLEG